MKTIAFILLVLSTTAWAELNSTAVQAAGFDKLSETQKAAVLKTIAEQADTESTESKAKRVSEWVDIGSKIGLGLAGAAKELGVAANDFVKTPVGLLTMGLVVWHFVGSMVLHFFGAVVMWAFGFSAIRWLIRNSRRRKAKVGDAEAELEPLSDDQQWCYGIAMIIVAGAGLLIMFTY